MRRSFSLRHCAPRLLSLLPAAAALVVLAGCGGGGTTAPELLEGTLVLRSTPGGATVLVNNEEIAQRTPIEVTRQVAAGGTSFEVVFRLTGYEEARQTALVTPGQATIVEVTLRALQPPDIPPHTITGKVLYDTGNGNLAPAAAAAVTARETTTDETFAGTMDASSQRAGVYYLFAPPGTYEVTAALSGYQSQTRSVTILSGEDRHTGIDFSLVR